MKFGVNRTTIQGDRHPQTQIFETLTLEGASCSHTKIVEHSSVKYDTMNYE